MHHTATHCNTLQHTATALAGNSTCAPPPPSATQHNASHCNNATHCNTLQHTAPHCNTLHQRQQATAPVLLLFRQPRNTLQHTATHCSTPQHTATHCTTLQHSATQCNTVQHTATAPAGNSTCPPPPPSAMQHTAAHCSTLQHTATHCNTLQHTATAPAGNSTCPHCVRARVYVCVCVRVCMCVSACVCAFVRAESTCPPSPPLSVGAVRMVEPEIEYSLVPAL